jgi:hypothetical protein
MWENRKETEKEERERNEYLQDIDLFHKVHEVLVHGEEQ